MTSLRVECRAQHGSSSLCVERHGVWRQRLRLWSRAWLRARLSPCPALPNRGPPIPFLSLQQFSARALPCPPPEPLSRPILLPGGPSPSPHSFSQVPLSITISASPSLPEIINHPLLCAALLLFQDSPAEHLTHCAGGVSPPGAGSSSWRGQVSAPHRRPLL